MSRRSDSSSYGMTPGLGSMPGTHGRTSFGLDGFTQPSGASHHHSGKFAGNGFGYAEPVRFTAKDKWAQTPPKPLVLPGSPKRLGTPPPRTPPAMEWSAAYPRAGSNNFCHTKRPSVLTKMARASEENNTNLIHRSGFSIY
jgi:hypothetical protein